MSNSKLTMEELFGENSLHLCKYRLDNNEIPSLEKLADIIEANSDAPLPDWFVKYLCTRLRHPDKPKKGRPRSNKPDKTIEMFAALTYQWLLKDFQEERKSASAAGKTRLKSDPPPSEHAARIIQRNYYKHMTWQAVRNLISSQK